MRIEKRIKLNTIYYIVFDVEYKTNHSGFPSLCLKNYKDDYWDGGDCSILIEKIEENYSYEKAKSYDANIGFMADVLYIYDRIPFLSGIRDVYISANDNLPYSIGYISKQEIDQYIQDNHIKMRDHSDFKLSNGFTWKID